jgi:hypothetical protein
VAAVKVASQQQRGIHHRQRGVQHKALGQLRALQLLHHRAGQGQARGFDQHMVDLLAALPQGQHGGQEVLVVVVSHQAIGQIVNLHPGLVVRTQDGAVDGHLAKLVDQNGQPPLFAVADQIGQQGGFARAQKTGEHGDRNARAAHASCSSAACRLAKSAKLTG